MVKSVPRDEEDYDNIEHLYMVYGPAVSFVIDDDIRSCYFEVIEQLVARALYPKEAL